MLKIVVKVLVAIFLIPATVGVSAAFAKNIVLIKELAHSMNWFLAGIASYVVLHLLFYKPTFLYVLGHEAVHAGMAWLFGGKIKSFKVSGEGGSVSTDKTNTVIELSPYFVPVYAIIITLVYFVIASSYTINGAVFVFLIGFALAFHIVSTVEVMKVRQPDFVKSGYFFSVILVYILNIIVISLIFSFVFPSFSRKKFFADIWLGSKDLYLAIWRQIFG